MRKTFNIEVTMNERWINDFCSMLRWMENCGKLGHSSIVGFYSDGRVFQNEDLKFGEIEIR